MHYTGKDRIDWILKEIGEINPYRRDQQNRKSEFFIYNMGFLASFLAGEMQRDSAVRARFQQICRAKRG